MNYKTPTVRRSRSLKPSTPRSHIDFAAELEVCEGGRRLLRLSGCLASGFLVREYEAARWPGGLALSFPFFLAVSDLSSVVLASAALSPSHSS